MHNPEEILASIEQLSAGFEQWQNAKNKAFDQRWNKQFDRESIVSAGSHAAAAAGGEHRRDELQGSLESLCRAYLDSGDEVRERLRVAVRIHSALTLGLHEHIDWCASKIKTSADLEWLRSGLASASITDWNPDYRDTFIALGFLYIQAVHAGLAPGPAFEAVAQISSSEKWHPKYSDAMNTKAFFLNFENSAFFRSSVAPKL